MVEYTITDNNIHIVDSYKVPKARFAPELEHIRLYHPRNAVLVNRSITSLSREWATHNALYCLGIFRSHTEAVDLEYPPKWYMSAMYWVVGAIVWPFIK